MPNLLKDIEELLTARTDVREVMAVDYLGDEPIVVFVKPDIFCCGPELRDLCADNLGPDAERVTIILVPQLPSPEAEPPDPAGVLTDAPYVYRYEPPMTATEQHLTGIWNEVLERPRTGVLDDFLDLGGDSYHAVQLINRITSELEVPMDIVDFFDASSVRAVAQIVDAARTGQ